MERSSSRLRPKTLAWSSAVNDDAGSDFPDAIVHSGRGIAQGQEVLTEDETELFGSKQLACVFYIAYCEDPSNSNVQRVLQEGYQVTMRHRSLPLDVNIEIVENSNRHHDVIKRLFLR